ncbi:Glycosidase [Treponema bryantii]|uniref:Glycosidase n=1 Tax=Treponema bryantii TaxID=163 RepID=A0A1H9FUK7_9SPIR|nr:alpha-amylase family glycosyl hydrolase [Treponema bryantii]SEQ41602.1 Glycosidase [Treponema bryantii]
MKENIELLNEISKNNVKGFIKKFIDTNFYTERYLDECVDIIGNNDLKKLDNMNIYGKELASIREKNKREERKQEKFAVIYEIFIRHYGATGTDLQSIGKLKHITKEKLIGLKEMGITHIWLMGLLDTNVYPYIKQGLKPQWIKGDIGSPYSVFNYKKIDPLYLDETDTGFDEFDRLIKDANEVGINIMIDLVPAHTSWSVENDRWIPNPNFEFIPFRTEGKNHYVGQYLLPNHGGIGKFRWRDTAEIDFTYNDINDANSVYRLFDDIVAFWQSKGIKGFRTDVSDGCPVSFWEYIISNAKKRDNDVFFLCEALSSYGDGLSFLGELNCFDSVYNYPFYNIVRNTTKGNWAQDLYQYPFDYNLQDYFPNTFLTYFQSHHDTNRIMSDKYSYSNIQSDAEKVEIGLSHFEYSVLRSNGQIMVYNGDEIGDCGNIDGISPLKTYYSYKEGFDKLSQKNEREQKIFNRYSYILNFAHKDIIKYGSYINLYDKNHTQNDNSERFFYNKYIDAFIRYYQNTVLLVISNFSRESKTISFDISQLANIVKAEKYILTDISPDKSCRKDIELSECIVNKTINRESLISADAFTLDCAPHKVYVYEVKTLK